MTALSPTLLLYNFPEEALSRLRRVLAATDIQIKPVPPSDFVKPVGQLAGLPQRRPSRREGGAGGAVGAMVVLCFLSGAQVDQLLHALRRAGASTVQKAVLTQTNAAWSAAQLYRALEREREEMERGR